MVKISLHLIEFDIIRTSSIGEQSNIKQEFTVKAWVAEQVDARDLKSFVIEKKANKINIIKSA